MDHLKLQSREKLRAAYWVASSECLEGVHGDGKERIESLKNVGFSDSQIEKIQNLVNGRITLAIKKYTDEMEF